MAVRKKNTDSEPEPLKKVSKKKRRRASKRPKVREDVYVADDDGETEVSSDMNAHLLRLLFDAALRQLSPENVEYIRAFLVRFDYVQKYREMEPGEEFDSYYMKRRITQLLLRELVADQTPQRLVELELHLVDSGIAEPR